MLVAMQDKVSHVRWENHLMDSHHMLTTDPSLMQAAPKHGGVPMVVHLHGAEVDSTSDGYPDSWYTAMGDHGYAYSTNNFTYANAQRESMLWYHDHAFGTSRLNVLSGLTGVYLIRSKEKPPAWMPTKKYEVVLLLQDKQFFHNGSINFPNVGDSVKNHPHWCPEYWGDTIIVNGKAWPYLHVKPRKYRFRLLNAANARFFEFSLNNAKLSFIQIGTDGGLLEKSQTLKKMLVAPAERVDFIIDFSKVPGCEVIMNNSGAAPYPAGDPANSPPSTNAVMKFIVKDEHHHPDDETAMAKIPAILREADAPLSSEHVNKRRTKFMFEDDDALGNPTGSYLSNLTWMDPPTETPYVGDTEIWEFINFTPDAHPMHIHLVPFKLINQQPFNLTLWQSGGCTQFNHSYHGPESCFTGPPVGPSPNQVGWKDTIVSLPNHVTRLMLKWTSQRGRNGKFPFDPTSGPGYVWHCHILDHEDNDMMRPIKLYKK